ncbi:hypothetical protein LXL04_014478 [Taraxacum kok-saghyz]
MSPANQFRWTETGYMLDKFTVRFRVGSIMIQLNVMYFSRLDRSTWSTPENLTADGTSSLGSRRSIQNGEDWNQSLGVVLVDSTLENVRTRNL